MHLLTLESYGLSSVQSRHVSSVVTGRWKVPLHFTVV